MKAYVEFASGGYEPPTWEFIAIDTWNNMLSLLAFRHVWRIGVNIGTWNSIFIFDVWLCCLVIRFAHARHGLD